MLVRVLAATCSECSSLGEQPSHTFFGSEGANFSFRMCSQEAFRDSAILSRLHLGEKRAYRPLKMWGNAAYNGLRTPDASSPQFTAGADHG